MADNATVERQEMAKAAAQIEQAHTTITGIQRTLGNNVQGLMTRWKGNAAQAYTKAFTQFDQQFTIVLNKFDELHGKLVDTQMAYHETESETEGSSGHIVSELNQ